ncbi:Molybdate-binding periplasmic protein [bacterium HR39]|nr:Molybdate-binding periplasmic protein [bacterium HR39]
MGFDRRTLLAAALAAAATGLGVRRSRASAGPLVAAASDLRWAMEEVADAFAAAGGARPLVVYGSSGKFFQQIVHGAPFELFLSADEAYVLELHRRDLVPDPGVLYAVGRIVVFAPDGSPLEPDPRLDGLKRALETGLIGRFSIADPAHAPYGARAKEALEATGLWEAVRPRLVFAANVAQAAQYALAGQVDGAIFALSLALAPTTQGHGRFAVIDASLHAPLSQRMVLLPAAGEQARAFFTFLQGREARAILQRYGFTLPGAGG